MDDRITRRVKIVGTLGPVSSSPDVIRKLMLSGLDVARLNMNYGTLEEHAQTIRHIKTLREELHLNTGILLDMPGYKKRSGNAEEVFGDHFRFAIANQIDFIALSFITTFGQAKDAMDLLAALKSAAPVIVKIERGKSLEARREILGVCDGLMVARGDLALDISIEKVPFAQKHIIKEANLAGKPVITATQMLESMVRSSTPTRAEATDVANAVLDGTDAVMLSEETAMGAYPVEAVETMVRIIRAAEAELTYDLMLQDDWGGVLKEVDDATARAACHIASQINAKAVVAFTTGGTTALRVSKYRPRQPILAVTPSDVVARRIALSWGVSPVIRHSPPSVAEVFDLAVEASKETGVAQAGDTLVITAGIPVSVAGGTNLIKVHKI